MGTYLLIESATQICSVALAHDGKIVAERHSDEPNAHSSSLAVFIDEIFKGMSHLDAVCVSSGRPHPTEHGYAILRNTSGLQRPGVSDD